MAELTKLLYMLGEKISTTLAHSLRTTTRDNLLPILKTNTENGTVIHTLAAKGDVDSLSAALGRLSEESDVYELLRVTTAGGRTAIHEAAASNHHSVIKYLLERLQQDQIFEILKVQDAGGSTALHVAVSKSHTESVCSILSMLTQEQKLAVMSIENGQREVVTDHFFECDADTKEAVQFYFNSANTFRVNRTLNADKR